MSCYRAISQLIAVITRRKQPCCASFLTHLQYSVMSMFLLHACTLFLSLLVWADCCPWKRRQYRNVRAHTTPKLLYSEYSGPGKPSPCHSCVALWICHGLLMDYYWTIAGLATSRALASVSQ